MNSYHATTCPLYYYYRNVEKKNNDIARRTYCILVSRKKTIRTVYQAGVPKPSRDYLEKIKINRFISMEYNFCCEHNIITWFDCSVGSANKNPPSDMKYEMKNKYK